LIAVVAVSLCASVLAKEPLDLSLAKANAEMSAAPNAAQAPAHQDGRVGSNLADDRTIPQVRKPIPHDAPQADSTKRHVKHAKAASSVKKSQQHPHKNSKKAKKKQLHRSSVA
jgi:hypothetical protein